MHKNYRIGLDVGTNSLGWSVLLLDKNNDPYTIEAAGVRIFTDGRDEKSNATLAATRRAARLARRRRDRFKQRQIFLLDELTKAGLFPADEQARADLQNQNPLELRARALKEELSPHQVGRALFHLNQRRGFQSNRKDRSEETTSGTVSRSARLLLEQMDLMDPQMPAEEYKKLSKEDKRIVRQKEVEDRKNALQKLADQKDLAYGGFLYARYQRGKPTRARPGAGDDGKLYDVYPTREIYEDEFNKIWAAQAAHHASLMPDELRERIRYVIFTQRPLKPQKLGRCTYLPKEDRTFRAMPSFQRYRIYQEVNNLEWATSKKKYVLTDHPEARDAIIGLLERPPLKEKPTDKNAKVSFHKMKTLLKKMELAEGRFDFNFETPKRKGFDGDLTAHIMQHEDYVGAGWHDWLLEKQDKFTATILDDKLNDEQVRTELMRGYGLSLIAAEKCMNAPLVDGTANVSLKAAQLMLEKMRDGVANENGEVVLPIQNEAADVVAVEVSEFINPMRSRKSNDGGFKPMDSLLYYGEVFQDGRHIIPGDRLEEDRHDERKFFGGVTNPTVHIALNQIRQVVNELIGRYGHPASIAIELGRDLPAGQEGRSEITKEQKENQERNDKFDRILREYGQLINRENRLRLLLWEELDADPNGRCCPFSGDKIGISDLFNGNAEIEHLIPFSRSLDDSRANKVICTRKANKDKDNQTPFEVFGGSLGGYAWDEIFERAKKLPKSKQWRFQEDAMKIWERDSDFTARHLNDTRYIGRLAREYLECICHIDKIDVLTGRLTALLRWQWGLNSVLRDDARSHDQQLPEKKNRDDHRHHAVDAIVIGMTSRSMLQKVASAANRAEKLRLDAIFEKHNDGKSAIDPWDGFRNEVRETVKNIIVSHKPKRRKQGQLHKEFSYGIADKCTLQELNLKEQDHPISTNVVLRRKVEDFKTLKHVKEIRNKTLQRKFLVAFDMFGKEGFAQLALELGIRRLRVQLTRTVQPIRDKKTREIYKAFWLRGNWGTEIYKYPTGHSKAGKWEAKTISRYHANQKEFQAGVTYRPHPTANLVMRLHAEDYVEIEEYGKKRLMRVQKMSGGGVYICEHQEANVADRLAELVNDNTAISASASRLKSLNARKVHISPTGKINYEIRRKPRRQP